MDATVFLALAGAVYKFTEFIKPALKKPGWSDDVYNAAVQLLACVIGVVLAFVAGGVNLLPAVLPVPPVAGVVITGIVIGLGADVVNAALDLFYGWQKPAPAAFPNPDNNSHPVGTTPAVG